MEKTLKFIGKYDLKHRILETDEKKTIFKEWDIVKVKSMKEYLSLFKTSKFIEIKADIEETKKDPKPKKKTTKKKTTKKDSK